MLLASILKAALTNNFDRSIVDIPIILLPCSILFVCNLRLSWGRALICAQFTTDGIDSTRFHFNAWGEGGLDCIGGRMFGDS